MRYIVETRARTPAVPPLFLSLLSLSDSLSLALALARSLSLSDYHRVYTCVCVCVRACACMCLSPRVILLLVLCVVKLLRRVVMLSRVLQCVAVCCSVLQWMLLRHALWLLP